MAKETKLGKSIMKDILGNPRELWVYDYNKDGKIIGRLNLTSGEYEKL